MADLPRGQLRRKRAELVLDGAHRGASPLSAELAVAAPRAAEQDIAALDERLAVKLQPYDQQHAMLMQIPSVDWLVAA
jgi:hypothetical protein